MSVQKKLFSQENSQILCAVHWIVLHCILQMSLKPDFLIYFWKWCEYTYFNISKVVLYEKKSSDCELIQQKVWDKWLGSVSIQKILYLGILQSNFCTLSCGQSPLLYIGESSIKIVKVRAGENVGFLNFLSTGEVHLRVGTAGWIIIQLWPLWDKSKNWDYPWIR